MKKADAASDNLAALQRRAEINLREQGGRVDMLSPKEIETLIRDLGTYQAELELRNEELRRALEETEARRREFADLYDFSPTGCFVLDDQGLIVSANHEGAALLGKEQSSLIGTPFAAFVSPEDLDRFAAHCQRTREELTAQTDEIKLNSPGNNALLVRLRSVPVAGNGGIVTALSDISDLKHADEFTRHLASFPKENPNPVMEIDVTGNVIFANAAAYTILENLGLRKDDVGRLLPADIGDILMGLQRNSAQSFSREVIIGGRVIGETINLVPQVGVARIYGRDITDHKLAQEALRQSEERFRLIAETSADVIFQLDVEGRVTYCSPALQSYGYSPDAVFGESFSKFLAQDDLAKAADALQRVNLGERLSLFEVTVLQADGSTADIELSATPIERNGTIIGIQGIARNISERKLAEKALRESEERLRFAHLAAKICAFEWNVQTGMNVWTPELEAMYGLAPGEFGKTQPAWEQLVHPEDRAAAVALVNRAFETGEPISGEWRVMWRDGSVHWIQGRFQLFRDKTGRPMRLAGVNIDITERKLSEQKLRESEEKLKLFIEHAPAAIAMLDSDMKFIRASLRWIKDYDVAQTDIIGRSLFDLFPDIPERWKKVIARCLAGAVERHEADPWVRADGRTLWIRWETRPWFKSNGLIGGIIIFSENITDLKEAELSLQRSLDEVKLNAAETNTIFTALDDAVLLYDTNMNVLRTNSAFAATYGFDPVGMNIREIIHRVSCRLPDGQPFRLEEQPTLRALQGEKVKGVQFLITRSDGADMIIETSTCPLVVGDRITGVVTVWHDITDAKRAEQQLIIAKQELEARVRERTRQLFEQSRILESFFRHTPTCLVFLDQSFNFIRVNEAYASVCGRDAADFDGHNYFIDYPSDDLKARFQQVVETKEPYRIFGRPFVFPDHPERRVTYWDLSVAPVLDEAAEVEFLVFALADVTGRMKAEAELRSSAAEIRDLYNNAPCGYHSLDKNGVIVEINDTELAWLGYSRDDVVGKMIFWDCLTAESRNRFKKKFPKLNAQGWIRDLECEVMRKDGSTFMAAVNSTAIRDKAGNFVMSRSTMYDITDRKDAERHATATNEVLKLFARTLLRAEYLNELVKLIRKWSNCEGVGMRQLDEAGNIPYAAYLGLKREFWDKEGCITSRKDQCVCPRVFADSPEHQDKRYLTPHGSFLCNNMHELVSVMGKTKRTHYQRTCAESGVASFAVIPIRYRGKVMATIHLVDRRTERLHPRVIEFIEAMTPLMGEALYRFNIEESLRSSREQLRSHSMHLLAAREEERVRVAREIHDDLGQTLIAARMELGLLKKGRGGRISAGQKISSVTDLIDNAIEDIHRICYELRPRVLDHLGLGAAIEWQAKKFAERAGLNCFLDLQQLQLKLPPLVSTALFRIFQESLTNVTRHAKASQVFVRLAVSGAELVLEVRDDGKGIPKYRLSGNDSFGLMGIRERVHQLGGKVTFRGVRNKGTTVTVTVPLPKGEPDV